MIGIKQFRLMSAQPRAGRALVCLGCAVGRSSEDGHGSVDGGRWGFIGKSGREIVPVTLTKAQAMLR